jgi:hypothetical protein
MSALITRERALRNLNYVSLSATDALLLDAVVAAASQGIEAYCQRTFAINQYDELYNGRMQRRLILRNYPLKSVERVAYAPSPVLRIRNLDSTTNQRARVQVTTDGLTLTRAASGVTTLTTLTFAANPTLTALASAIIALGNSWTASVLSPAWNSFPSDELKFFQGAFDALASDAQLKLHISELSDFEIDHDRGWLLRSRSMEGYPYPPGHPTGIVWFGGINYWRVQYTAGFDAVPEDVQEACAEWSAQLFWQMKRDPGLYHDIVHGVYTHVPFQGRPQMVEQLLAPYKTRKFLSLGS